MTQRLLRPPVLTVVAVALLLAVAPAGSHVVHTDPRLSIGAWLGSGPSQASAKPELVEKIAFSSTRVTPGDRRQIKIFLMNPDGTNPEQLTSRDDCLTSSFRACGDGFASLSPNGKTIVFDSNRNKAETDPINTSELFVMNPDGTEQTFLTRGSSASWSPHGPYLAFHRSVSGTGLPIYTDAGAPYPDSDIFVMNINADEGPTNITNTPGLIEDDANWSPDGRQIVYVRQPNDPVDLTTSEIYVLRVSADGTPVQGPDNPRRLTFNGEQERGPAWSPDGTQIAYMCQRLSPEPNRRLNFEICVVDADGTNERQLTDNDVLDATPSWSLDGQHIVVNRLVTAARNQIFKINANGTGETQLTNTLGTNEWPSWGVVRVDGRAVTPTPTSPPAPTPPPTATNTPTDTPVPPTNTPTDTPTNTPEPPTNTPTNTPTDTPTNTPEPPTNTPTNTPTDTPTETP